MNEYVVIFNVAKHFSNGDLRLQSNMIRDMLLNEIKKFKHRVVRKNVYEVKSSYEPVTIYKLIINATYSDEDSENLFDESIDTLYVAQLAHSDILRVINGKFLKGIV